MEPAMTKEELQAKVDQLEAERLLRDKQAATYRARSISVGTAFGGTTEVSMRSDDGSSLWCFMQPVEVIELIHQLAANVGCHVALKPRKDFASWRDWRVTEEEKLHYNGWAPFVNDMAPFQQLGASGMDPAVLAAIDAGGKVVEGGGGKGGDPNKFEPLNKGDENVVATKKLKDRRSTKRTAKAA